MHVCVCVCAHPFTDEVSLLVGRHWRMAFMMSPRWGSTLSLTAKETSPIALKLVDFSRS